MERNAHAPSLPTYFARILLERGVTVRDVADLLGNSEQIVRKHYGAWRPGTSGNGLPAYYEKLLTRSQSRRSVAISKTE